jgi:hypothetical protein
MIRSIPICVALGLAVSGCGLFNSAKYRAREWAGNPRNPMPGVETVALVFVNASNVDYVDEPLIERFTQIFHSEIQQFPGLRAVPPLAAYNVMRVKEFRLPVDAKKIAAELDADALLVGLITDYYPYENPRMGVDLILFPVNDSPATAFDVATLQQSGLPLRTWDDVDMNLRVHRVIDANYDDTRRQIAAYASLRTTDGCPDGTDHYLMVMPKFMAFVSNRMIRTLIAEANDRLEQANAAREAAEARASADPPVLPY